MAAQSALEDVRLLARGQLLIGGMCSRFTEAVYGAMVAHNGFEVPTISLDRCQPAQNSCDPKLAPWGNTIPSRTPVPSKTKVKLGGQKGEKKTRGGKKTKGGKKKKGKKEKKTEL